MTTATYPSDLFLLGRLNRLAKSITSDTPSKARLMQTLHRRLSIFKSTCMSQTFESFISELRTSTGSAHLAVDFEQPTRRHQLSEAVSARVGVSGSRVAPETVLEQAGARYFSLVARARRSLKGRFSEAEWSYILNTECTPIWQWDAGLSVATMVADDNGIESADDAASDEVLGSLLDKLVKLSPLENATLVDACEQVWRGYDNPLA